MSAVYAFLRFVLGQIFIVASFDKLLHPAAFADIVANYQLLPGFLVAPVAVLLPWVEMACGLALVINKLTRGAALILLALLTAFLGALAFNTARGLDVACGCFVTDPGAEPHALLSLVRDGLLWLTAVVVLAGAVSDKRQPG